MRADRPSATARLIARSLLLAAHEPALAPLLPPGEADLLGRQLRAAGERSFAAALFRRPWARALLFGLERGVMPGIILHYIARKRWFEAAARAALADGARQVVVLGAGYDTLAWRLAAAHPEVRFLELDHPATQASKRRALGETQNFRLAAIDFAADSLGGALRAANFSSTQPTLFVAEGLLMYLSTARVAELLRELAEAAPGRARLAFSYLLRAAGGRIALARLPWAGLWLRWQGEPFLWAAEPARLADFLRGHGWAAGRPVDGSTLRAQLPVPSRFARGARAAGEQFMVAVAHP